MTPHQKIKRAALNDTGLRLTADECREMYLGDEAIRACADNDDGWYGQQNVKKFGNYAAQKRAAQGEGESRG